MPDARLLTVAEAMQATGLSRDAIEARIKRGTLAAERRGRTVLVPLPALYDAGLLRLPGPGALIGDLLDRLEEQAREIGRQAQRIAELEARAER